MYVGMAITFILVACVFAWGQRSEKQISDDETDVQKAFELDDESPEVEVATEGSVA
jgi:hypothetical protein